MKTKIFVGLLAFAVISCAQKKVNQEVAVLDKSYQITKDLSKDLYSDGRSKMIKTADCRFQVGDRKKSKEAIITSIKKYSGYIESSNLEFQNLMLEEKL